MRLKYYELYLCHYFSIPVLSWDVILKMTAAKLDLVLDIDTYQFIENRMRGGVSYGA